MRKYDKSLNEVWNWKEKVYEDVKDLSADKYIEKLRKDADKVLSENLIKLTTVSSKKKHHKVA